MSQPNSSTSSSNGSRLGPLKTAGWFVFWVASLELVVFGVKRVPPLSQTQVAKYFDYGTSIETKIRGLASEPDLPRSHVFNTGWLDLSRFPPANERCDVAVYGMSFAKDLNASLRALRPDLQIREYNGPGVPLSHAYAAYRMDVSRRSAKAVMIPLLSDGYAYLRTLTHDTRASDHTQPVTWPRFELRDGRVMQLAEPAIRSPEALRSAVLEDPALWQRHLAVLAAHDEYYSRWLYASHWTESLASLRLVRRALSHSRTHDHRGEIIHASGFIPETETAQLMRAMLRQYIEEVRSHGELPVVVLFDSPGEGRWLSRLLDDVLVHTGVEVVRSEDHCDAAQRENYTADGHFTPACYDAIARQFIELFDQSRDRHLALDDLPSRRAL